MVFVEEVGHKEEQEDQEDMEEKEEEEEEDPYDKEEREARKKQEFMGFRREFDKMKRTQEGLQADSDKIKTQGNHFFSLGLFFQATAMYSEAIDLQPENALLYGNRSMAYLKQHMFDEALVDAETSLELDDSVANIKAYWRKAQALLDLERPEEAVVVADEGLALQGGNKHLNGVRRKAREVNTLRRLVGGTWVGKMQGGIEKSLSFSADGSMLMCVFNHPIPSTFDLSVEGNPRSMVVKMKPEGDLRGTGPPPPPMVYIFEFHDNDEELWICHPVGTNELPTKFEGPGFEKLRRAPKSDVKQEDESDAESLEVRCDRYIREMNAILPLLPQQLPERPSDEQVSEEAQLMEQFTQLRRRYPLQVHQRSVELAKDPSQAGSTELAELALDLQRRFVARKIMKIPSAAPAPSPKTPAATPAFPEVTISTGSPQAFPANPAAAPASQKQADSGCMCGLVSRLCGGHRA